MYVCSFIFLLAPCSSLAIQSSLRPTLSLLLPFRQVYATKDAVIICIDASSSMQAVRPAVELDQDEEEGDEPRPKTFFAGALDCALQWEKRKAFLSPNDLVGILIYNTVRSLEILDVGTSY